jgi:hypothetical protein
LVRVPRSYSRCRHTYQHLSCTGCWARQIINHDYVWWSKTVYARGLHLNTPSQSLTGRRSLPRQPVLLCQVS